LKFQGILEFCGGRSHHPMIFRSHPPEESNMLTCLLM